MRAGIDITVADRADHLRLGQIDQIVIALLVVRQPGIACIVLRRQFRALDRRTVWPVLDQDELLGSGFEFFAFGHGQAFGRRPSMWQIA